MEVRAAARLLWARRRLVGACWVLACAIGVLMVYQVKLGLPPSLKSKQTTSGEGSAMVLLDTPRSQIADLDPPHFDPSELTNQASLLADLAATYPVAEQIAARERIAPGQLLVTPPPSSLGQPIRPSPLGLAATRAALGTPAAYKLSLTLDANLPMIAISTIAPTWQRAQGLAAGTIAVLQARLDSIAASQQIPVSRRVVLSVIDPPAGAPLVGGTRRLYGMVAAVLVFALACLGIVIVTRMRLRRRALRPVGEDDERVASELVGAELGGESPIGDLEREAAALRPAEGAWHDEPARRQASDEEPALSAGPGVGAVAQAIAERPARHAGTFRWPPRARHRSEI